MKGEEKRKALRSAVKRELHPLVTELGFAPDKPPLRTCGWPSFMIEFWADLPGKMRVAIADSGPPPRLNDTARIYPRRYGQFRPRVDEPWCGRRSVEETMRVAKLRLAEPDGFL